MEHRFDSSSKYTWLSLTKDRPPAILVPRIVDFISKMLNYIAAREVKALLEAIALYFGTPKDLAFPFWSGFSFLEELNLRYCNITELPESLGQYCFLKSLQIAGNMFESIPKSIESLCKLMLLDVSFCSRLQCLPDLPCQLEYVKAQSCTSLQKVSNLSKLLTNMERSQNRVLSFINCSELDYDALAKSVADALVQIRQNSIHRWEFYEMVFHDATFFFCFPGNKIPECFNFQNTGANIELPQDWFNCNLNGLTFCTVIAFGDHHHERHDLIVNCELLLKTKDGNNQKVAVGFLRGWYKDDAPDYFVSDHVFLGYDCNMYRSGFPEFSDNSRAMVNFYVSNKDGKHLECCKVKKCGISLSYNQHSGEAVEGSSRSCISTEEAQSGLSNRQVKYDVCLSFKGKDTRNNFTSHLRAALYRAKIETSIDNEDDELIGQDRMNAIEESRISIIIFSKGYASSKCCMEELVQILECKKKYGQAVIPIFYNVDRLGATDVLKNPEYLKQMPETQKKWFIALREATDLDGFNSNFFWCESDLVEAIVKRVLKILNLVGVQSRIKKIGSLLHTSSKDVRIVGILGISGIGKTTITKALFDEIEIQFEGSYFALNVSEESKSLKRLTLLRQELFTAILKDGPSALGNIFTKLSFGAYKRVLIVLDDVTSSEQIKFLIRDLHCLGLGSRIIITTRDRQVLKNCGVDDDLIYRVDALFHLEALQLFSWYAFQQNHPPSNYDDLSKSVVEYAKGVPLALKVLGSFLREKTKSEWESAISNLKGNPCKDIQMVLEVSYKELDDYEKNIFLDIACFLNWECRDFVIKFLNVSGFYAEIGMSVLIDRCLITVSNNRIIMNALLQEMGCKIVQEENSRDPSKRSRLWYHADIYHVLKNNMGSEALEGICLDMSKITHIVLNPHAFAEMSNLRFLKIYDSHCGLRSINELCATKDLELRSINKLCATKDLEFLFSELSYLCWHGFPLESLPSDFCLQNLVALDMPYSDIQQLWTGDQILFNLKTIDLSYSKRLQKSPNFLLTPNLESLILEGCTSLLEISSSINCLDKLVILNLRQCKRLSSLPTSIDSKFLRKVILSSCSNLKKFPIISSNIEELFLDGTAIKELLPWIENPSRLLTLNFEDCSRLESLPSNLCLMKSLEHLNLSGCSKLDRLPNSLGDLKALKVLKAERLAQREVPSSIASLQFLKELNLTDCGIVKLPRSLRNLSSLESLFLGRNNFESIPPTVLQLPKLCYLDLSYCQRLQFLPVVSNCLQYVNANGCTSLEGSLLTAVFEKASFINCFKLEQNELLDYVIEVLLNVWNLLRRRRPRPSAYICFPGNQIPEWFTFQIIGASVSAIQTSGKRYTGSVSFAVCAVVEFRNYQDDGHGLVVRCECKLGNRDGAVVLYYGIPPNCIDSEHTFLGYDLHMCNFDLCDSRYNDDYEVSIQFYVEDLNGKRIDSCEVKKCGFYLLFHNVMRDDNDGDDEEEPPFKKLKGVLL
ncbi:disease resistance-like protein DSC1 isoform X2 [Pistacia vera]|uniref:disease resistance-like protein DSC1 isoform X2 n=1 Tax=Pistacia vera TaxID=55513 RepID=UPI001263898F|nr:disease resistance-like protein DSC1 isoform X2 [Pistacia vera]